MGNKNVSCQLAVASCLFRSADAATVSWSIAHFPLNLPPPL